MTMTHTLLFMLVLSPPALASELIGNAAQKGKGMKSLTFTAQPSPRPNGEEKSRPLNTGAYEISEEQRKAVKKSLDGISEITKSNESNQKPLDLVR